MQINVKGLNKKGARQEIENHMEQINILVGMISDTITKKEQTMHTVSSEENMIDKI